MVQTRSRSFYVQLAYRALLAVPAAQIVLGAVILIVGQSTPRGVTMLLGLHFVVTLAFGLLLRWSDSLLIPAVIVSLLTTLISFGLEFEYGLGHPESFFDFVTAVVTIGFPLVATVACVLALAQRRGGPRPTQPNERFIVPAFGVAFVVVAMGSAVITLTSRSTADAPSGAIAMTLKDSVFEPSELRVARGDRVRLFVRNEDSFAHTFTVDELAIDEYVGPRASKLIELSAESPRRPQEEKIGRGFVLYCAVTGHEDMVGTILVR